MPELTVSLKVLFEIAGEPSRDSRRNGNFCIARERWFVILTRSIRDKNER